MNHPYLLLWLEAPLQAWGHDSKFGRRDSLEFPTKSGILGLLCCARGRGGEETEWLAEWVPLDMQVVAYARQDSKQQSVRQPALCDFQMVGSGYDHQDKWQTLLIPKTEDGKKAVGGGTKMNYRFYLQDMAFAVAIQTPTAFVPEAISALQNPVWDLYLGRKNCVPTEFIYQGLFDTATEAIAAGQTIAQGKKRSPVLLVLQGEHEGERLILNDVPLQFGRCKKYQDRRVSIQRME